MNSFTKKCSMKKLLTVVVAFGFVLLFFACQKSNDVINDSIPSDEILTCSGGGGVNEAPPPLECGVFRTQSQGGWGTYPYGSNAGKYLQTHFSAAFPTGLKIGCEQNGYSVSFTSASAITRFLPASGTPSILTINQVDPSNGSVKNVLIGQVAALAINVGFDFYYDDFSPAEERLGNLQIASGPFAGMNVSEFLSLANLVLGGCGPDYSVEAINKTASALNANFLDGRTNGGFVICPVTRIAER